MRRPVLVLLVVAACGGPPAPAAPGGASPAPVAAFDDDDAFAATVMPQVLDTGGGTIRALVVSPDGARLAALKSGSVQVWAVGGDGRLTALGDAVEYRHDDAEGACITASSRTLATSADGAVHVYDLDGAPRERARWDLPEDVLGFGLPDDDHLVVVTRLAVVALAIGPDGGVTITHEEALPARAFDAALSCDGRWLDVKPAGVDRRDLYAVDPGTGAVHAATAADVPAAGATDAADAVRVGDAQWTIAAAGVTRL
ncbi:MAG: hypothetical protein KC464_35080, partial [Myxococcales bacterium]|nr:hypothetical protein [Myxococcales bacterium]